MREVGVGVIGCGLMGREFASAAARWLHLTEMNVRPRIVAVVDPSESAARWFHDNVEPTPVVCKVVAKLLEHPGVEAVYVAVPHHLHESIYRDVIRSGKAMLAEKPFGIDLDAASAISSELQQHPESFVRVSSEFPFFPGAQRVVRAVQSGELGTIIEAEAKFLHSSDLDPNKPINWKRRIATNGAYGCLGDLGLHVLHLPLRFGWKFESVFAELSKIVSERPDGHGSMVPCETWDNATLLCRARDASQTSFPIILETKRIAPGETNTWSIRVAGTRGCVEFSTKLPKTLKSLTYSPGGPQSWQYEDLGYAGPFRAITGAIFEFGFPDAILQMWAAFLDEYVGGNASSGHAFRCATPEEAMDHHRILTAALQSQRTGQAVDPRTM